MFETDNVELFVNLIQDPIKRTLILENNWLHSDQYRLYFPLFSKCIICQYIRTVILPDTFMGKKLHFFYQKGNM